MFPILFRIGDAALFTYPLLFSLAVFLGMGVWIQQTRRDRVPIERIVHLSLMLVLIGLVGARALYILTQWSMFWSGERKIWALWEGGVVYFGGFLAAGAYLYFALPRNGLPRARGFDTLAPAVAFAHALGRVACFANGCCYGTYCRFPWGVSYRSPYAIARPLETPLHPSQIYEALGLCLLGWILVRNNRGPARFATRNLYLFGYGCLRFAVEFTRGDLERGHLGVFSTSQWLSLAIILTALSLDFAARGDHKLHHES